MEMQREKLKQSMADGRLLDREKRLLDREKRRKQLGLEDKYALILY